MPKLIGQITTENTSKIFKMALMRLGANEKRFGLFVSKRLGCSEKTGLRYVKEPYRLTVRDMRLLRLNDEEILQIVRGT